MATLPTNRTIDAVLLMAPSVHATGPRGAYSITGAQSYENLYTLNGAVIIENLRGRADTPYIEDALQEVTVATAGVSAEYGRFSGGMVNAVTKSGGNTFSGSFRTSFANDYWRSLTPFESTQLDRAIQRQAEAGQDRADLRGDVRRADGEGAPVVFRRHAPAGTGDRRGRHASTNIPYIRDNDEKRYEGKLTYAPRPGHSIQGSYIDDGSGAEELSPSSNRHGYESLTNQGQPQICIRSIHAASLSPNFSVEAQYSART